MGLLAFAKKILKGQSKAAEPSERVELGHGIWKERTSHLPVTKVPTSDKPIKRVRRSEGPIKRSRPHS